MENKIVMSGIFGKGYGLVPRLVMQDRNLDTGSKLLYAYLCSFTGSERSCYPSREKICFDLGIGNNTLARYLAKLKDCGYIKIEKLRENGRFGRNLYILLDTPAANEQCTDEQCTDEQCIDEPCTAEQCMDEPCIEKQYTAEQYTDDSTTINNNKINTTSINNNSITNTSIKESACAKKAYGRYENVFLSDEELDALMEEFPWNYADKIEDLSAYIASSGKKYSSHLATIRNWAKREREKSKAQMPKYGYLNDESDEEAAHKWDFAMNRLYMDLAEESSE